MHMYIPYGKQSIDEKDIEAVAAVLRSDFLTTGPLIQEFEKKVAESTGAAYAVAVANGTAALHAACAAAGITTGDEVITTPITFAASANCIRYCGGTPVFADIDPKTYNISPKEIEKKITNKTKAIIAVHFTGQPCELDEIHAIAKKYHLIVIEDAAHALGAKYNGKRIGALSDMTTFSFHPVKQITTGEGGMILTNSESLYSKLSLFRTHGITRDNNRMENWDGPWYYEQIELGYNYRITDIQCALGISQMDKLPVFLEKRKKIAKRYDEAFAECPNIEIPYQKPGCENAYHLYVIRIKNKERIQVFNMLRASGIGVNVHYIPVYSFPYYKNNGYADVHYPNAESYYAECISLPIYPALQTQEQEYVIREVYKAVNGG